MVWLKQPPERRGTVSEAWKALASSTRLDCVFAGLVDGGALGNVGVRLWGSKPADCELVAHVAELLGAPAPMQSVLESTGRLGPKTSWCWCPGMTQRPQRRLLRRRRIQLPQQWTLVLATMPWRRLMVVHHKTIVMREGTKFCNLCAPYTSFHLDGPMAPPFFLGPCVLGDVAPALFPLFLTGLPPSPGDNAGALGCEGMHGSTLCGGGPPGPAWACARQVPLPGPEAVSMAIAQLGTARVRRSAVAAGSLPDLRGGGEGVVVCDTRYGWVSNPAVATWAACGLTISLPGTWLSLGLLSPLPRRPLPPPEPLSAGGAFLPPKTHGPTAALPVVGALFLNAG